MVIDFYKTESEPRELNKTVTDKLTVSGVFAYGDISILSPAFILEYNNEICQRNIFYVETLKRWYSITNITIQSAGKMIVSGMVDVLQTYKENILNCAGQAVRATSAGMTLIPDTAFPIIPGKEFVTTLYLSDSDLDPPEILPPNPYKFVLALKK